MQTSRASTRRAALAAFLLFAAGLLVIGPAEASRTTNAHSSLAPISAPSLASSSSRELASLELSPLEPADSASISSRFGFAEELGLLDVEARPCGFMLFGGVGTSRCELTYARNNPLKYVDPDGMEPKKPYVTLTFNQRELPTRAQTLEFFQRSINDPFSISLSRARLETPTIFEGDSATAANFEKGLRDSDGLSVFVGHAVVLGTGGLVFSDKQSMLKEVTNNNGIVCLAACDTSRLAGKLGITDKTVGRAFVGTIGSPNSLDLANLAARFLSLINGGNSVGDAVKSLNRDLAGDKKLYRLAVTGDGKVRVEK